MADIADRAHDLEELQRKVALNAVQSKPRQPQARDTNGRIICIDCGVVIPPLRLKHIPGVLRCIDCQQIHEQQTGSDRK